MDHSNPAPATTPAKAQRVLVLQGGGALGSYQAGAFQALCRSGFEPEWVAGISIGAINAAIMISQYRQNNGLGTVVVDPELTRLAEQQSQAMAARNKMDHNVKGPLDKRLGASGYPAAVAVENVSAGYHTLAEAFSGWRDSPPHKANMLKNGVTKLGIAAAYAPNTKYKVFWTLILAST